jgi:hypothetical protein
MYDPDIEKLLERSLAGDPAGAVFRERVLRSSAAALGAGRKKRVWRYAACAAAALVIAATAFVCGRASVPRVTVAKAAPGETVSVPVELVAWLDAARFFKQLDMPDRVTLAYERAGKLVPHETLEADAGSRTAFAAAMKRTQVILAQALGE